MIAAVVMDAHIKQLLSLGREHYDRNEYVEAEYLLRQVIAKADRCADVFNMLGVISHSRGHVVRAQEYFERAVHLNPHYTEAQLNLMVTYNELGKYEEARRTYASVRGLGRERGARIDPFAQGKIANMHAEIANAYRDAGMLSAAIRELERAIELRPSFADLRARLAAMYRDTGNTGAAIEQLEQAKVINPGYFHGRVFLGAVLLAAGDKSRAIQELRSVLDDDPDNQPAKMYLKAAHGRGDSLLPAVPHVKPEDTHSEPGGAVAKPSPVPKP